jgi:N-acetylmuramoyl-L-alanine amidase/Putative peptidoglycan binding domain
MKIVISSGHGKKIRGAAGPKPWGLDEVDEARRVVEETATMLRDAGVDVTTFHDDISTSQNENLNRIVDFHNSKTRDLDVSVHFNAFESTGKPMGTECLYVSQQALADKVSAAIADAGDLLDRGPKKRTNLFFLNNTKEPAILIETCFVDSQADAELYRQNFNVICASIAEVLSGQEIKPPAPTPPGPEPAPPPPSDEKPELHKGDRDVPPGNYVSELQRSLNREDEAGLRVDGDFGSATDAAVRGYQASRGLDPVDGWCGEDTWNALDTHKPPLPPPPGALTPEQQRAIKDIVSASSIFNYSWRDRGKAPKGYSWGMGLAFAQTYIKLLGQHPAAIEMSKARKNSDKDALNVYRQEYASLSMSNEQNGPETLRHLYALLLGQGMRESSGKHCEGRDMSADNVQSDTAEAGLFQTSYNAHGASDPEFDALMAEYSTAAMRPTCYLDTFAEGVSCSSSDWSNFGSGTGAAFQKLCKECPAFAVETCALTLRNLCNHYGPIVRHETELKREADEMFKAVQTYVDREVDV